MTNRSGVNLLNAHSLFPQTLCWMAQLKMCICLICFWLIQWWWSIQSVLRTHTHTFRSTKGLFVLLAGRVCEFGEQGWDYSIISYRGPGESQSPVPAAWSGMAVATANHNRGRARTQKRWTAARDRYTPPLSHTCGFLKESNLVNDFILKACSWCMRLLLPGKGEWGGKKERKRDEGVSQHDYT